ncbi:MAG: glutamate--tRNA ligase family protein, partial [Clostridia bacterium]|nr:glutamate--tRNA ligase family protein [Clostridia bacterium]
MIRTRFAPSPTGYLHLGTLRTALYTYLFARKNSGTFILRIEDTDQAREVADAAEAIIRALKTAGLAYDEGPDCGGDYGPYTQSQRLPLYQKYAQELIEKGAAYKCFCNTERLDALRESITKEGGTFRYDKHCLNNADGSGPYCIRQNMPTEGSTTFTDLLCGDITVENAELDDGVLIKTDGMPTYNFANVIDDHLMRISHV